MRRNISVFQARKRKVSDQGQGLLVYSMIDLNSHADTIVCGSNCIVMHLRGKEYDVAPHTDAYETIKAVPIVWAATAYHNPETGETIILILNEAICMGESMDHTLVNPKQLHAYGMTFQDNPFAEASVFIATEDREFILPLSFKGTILGVATRTSTDKEL